MPEMIRKAFAVHFSELDRWSVSSFAALDWCWPEDVISPLRKALKRKSIGIDPRQDGNTDIKLITIQFTGDIIPREREASALKGNLFRADAGDVVFSKIDVRNGAIGVIPQELGIVAVTSEFPVYSVDTSFADPEYIKLLFRTQAFRGKINGMISGASGRKRVQPDDLERMEVPLPSIDVQRAIVHEWQQAQLEAERLRSEVADLERSIEIEILSSLGLTIQEKRQLPKSMLVEWSDLERWSVMFNQLHSVGMDLDECKVPVLTLGDVATISYGVQKSPQNRPGSNARPYLRVANVQRGKLDLREMKYIEVSEREMDSLRLEIGDILVCEGNSPDLVGRPAIWEGEIEDCVHQNHILKARIDRQKANPYYVLEYMNTTPARQHFRSCAKFTTNLASINSNDLRNLPLPLPDILEQERVVGVVKRIRDQTRVVLDEISVTMKEATEWIENAIVGCTIVS